MPSPALTTELPPGTHSPTEGNSPDASNDMEINETDIAPPGSLPEKTMTFGMGVRRNPTRQVFRAQKKYHSQCQEDVYS